MEIMTDKIREIAKEALLSNKVQMVIGWEKGDFSFESTPVFITEAEKADSLVFDKYCVNNLK